MEAASDQLARLARLYADMGDAQLLALAARPDDLTGHASLALAAELRHRHLAPHPQLGADSETSFTNALPGIVPSPNQALETASPDSGQTLKGMTALISFYDGLQLSKACAALEDADIEVAIHEVPGEPSSGVPGRFELWVETAAQPIARTVLHEKMALFPTAEVDANHPDSIDPDSIDPEDPEPDDPGADDLVVASFTSVAEAEEVRALLAAAGFSPRVEGDDLDPDETSVLVPAAQQERALDHLAAHLNLEKP